MAIDKPVRPTSKGEFPNLETGLHDVALGNMTQFKIGVIRDTAGVFIAVERKGAYLFQCPTTPGYVKDKLNIAYDSDANNLTDFVNSQLINSRNTLFTKFGSYEESLCVKQ